MTDPGRLRIGIDTGGTFTDVVAFDPALGVQHSTKVPSVRANPAEAFVAAVQRSLAMSGVAPSEIQSVFHGTTVATNALLSVDVPEGLGFFVTEGFRHVFEIGRQSVPGGYGNSYFWVKPERIVPVQYVVEVPERLDASGAVLRGLDESTVAEHGVWLREQGIEMIGVCLLHSYQNPEHERRVRDILREVHPDAWISISSDVLREYREYERSVTTAVDAFVKPHVSKYLESVQSELDRIERDDPAPLLIMKSNGGVGSVGQINDKPIVTALSGPAAGVLGAAFLARAAGVEDIVTIDAGGTSSDVAVVRGHDPTMTTEGSVGRYPIKVPLLDIATIGIGGGSIAWISDDGGLKVGPRSAEADPGPLCYGKGGTEVTVTDAALHLGLLPAALIGGGLELDAGAARAGIEKLAEQLGIEADDCAAGIMELAAWNQSNEIRRITVQRGLDVRRFTLVAFGGSGPLTAGRLMQVLGVERAIVPLNPGNVSAFGLHTVDVRTDHVRTFVVRHDELDVALLGEVFGELEAEAVAMLEEEGFDRSSYEIVRTADLRYDGQAFEVAVPVPPGPVDRAVADAAVAAFHGEHERLYGYGYRDQPIHGVEWVNARVGGLGAIPSIEPPRVEARNDSRVPEQVRERRVQTGEGWASVPIYERADLAAGDRVAGPAVIEEFGSTVPVIGDMDAVVDEFGNLHLVRKGAS